MPQPSRPETAHVADPMPNDEYTIPFEVLDYLEEKIDWQKTNVPKLLALAQLYEDKFESIGIVLKRTA